MGMVTWNLERNADRWLTVANYAQANGVVALQELPRTTGNGEVTPPHGAVRTTRTFGNPNDAAYVWGRAKRSLAPAAVILSRNPHSRDPAVRYAAGRLGVPSRSSSRSPLKAARKRGSWETATTAPG